MMMNGLRSCMWMVGAVAVSCLLLSDTVQAQGNSRRTTGGSKAAETKAAKGAKIAIKELKGLGSESLLETPNYNTTQSKGARVVRKWIQISAEIDVSGKRDEWVEGVACTFYALLQNKEKGEWTMLSLPIDYYDAKGGSKSMLAAYLLPGATDRCGDLVAIGAELTVGGEAVASEGASKESLGDKWWANPKVVDSPKVTRKEGLLLKRQDTPFAFVNPDDFEIEK